MLVRKVVWCGFIEWEFCNGEGEVCVFLHMVAQREREREREGEGEGEESSCYFVIVKVQGVNRFILARS